MEATEHYHVITALLVSALPVNQARHILRDRGYSKAMQFFICGGFSSDHVSGYIEGIISWLQIEEVIVDNV